MIDRIKYKKLLIKINNILLLLLIITTTTPIITRNFPYLSLIIIIIWTFSMIFIDKNYLIYFSRIRICLYIMLFYFVITLIFRFNDGYVGNTYNYMFFIYIAIIGDAYIASPNDKFFKFIFKFFTITLIMNLITNIIELRKNQSISKLVTGGVISNKDLLNTNVGNYLYAFFIGLCAITYLYIFFYEKIKFKKISFFIISIMCFYACSLASSLISIITVTLGSIFLVVARCVKSKMKKIMIAMVILSLLLLLLLFKYDIYIFLNNIIQNIDNNLIRERLYDLSKILIDYKDINLSGRIPLYTLSINSFLKNPIFGVGIIFSPIQGNLVVGNHSQVFDDLARMGIIVFSVYFITFKLIYNKINLINSKSNVLIKSIFYSTIIFALFNPVLGKEIATFLFIILPLAIKQIKY